MFASNINPHSLSIPWVSLTETQSPVNNSQQRSIFCFAEKIKKS